MRSMESLRLIELHGSMAKAVVMRFTGVDRFVKRQGRTLDEDTLQDWISECYAVLCEAVDEWLAGEREIAIEARIYRRMTDRLLVLHHERARYNGMLWSVDDVVGYSDGDPDAEYRRANSLNPEPDELSRQQVDHLGMVQVILFAQCIEDHPFHAIEEAERKVSCRRVALISAGCEQLHRRKVAQSVAAHSVAA